MTTRHRGQTRYTVTVDMPVTPMAPEMMALLLRWIQQFTLTPCQAEHLAMILRTRVRTEGE
jgi:hypothetical protein